MEKIDRRIARTHELLGNALISLIIERGYEAITIKDVTERADVAYVTFFRHYRDLDELLVQRLEASIDALMVKIDAAYQRAPGQMFGAEQGRMIFAHVQENASLYRILLNSRGATHVRKRVQKAMAGTILAECPPLLNNPAGLPPEMVANHIAASELAMIEWWLDQDMPYSIDEMARCFDQLITRASMVALETPLLQES
jgi:AcrR family transcriptional regulator